MLGQLGDYVSRMVKGEISLKLEKITIQALKRIRDRIIAVLLLASTITFCGCALWNKEGAVFHAINYPAPKPHMESPISDTIMVYRFLMDSSVDTHYLLISDSKTKTKPVSHHAWIHDPSEMITELVTRDMESSGLFQKAVDQTSNLPYRYALEGTITKFEGKINNGNGSSLIEVEVKLIDFEPQSVGQKLLIKKVYTIRNLSTDTTPESLVKALNAGVKELSEKIRNDAKLSLIKNAH